MDARFRPPSATFTPGLRRSLVERTGFRVEDHSDGSIGLRPAEVAGPVRYLEPVRLCDRHTRISRDTWSPLERFARRDWTSTHEKEAHEEIQRRVAKGTIEAQLSAFSLALLVLPARELESFLTSELPGLFTAFPDASLWIVGADDLLLTRLSFMRVAFHLSHVPDLKLGREGDDARRALQDHGITGGVNFAAALDPAFLIFSPAATGYAAPWPPHAVVIDFGKRMDLRRDDPPSRAALYEPSVLGRREGRPGIEFGDAITPGHTASLLSWWVERLNVIYGFAADPRNFVDHAGWLQTERQVGWHLTVERVLADLRVIGAGVHASQLVRLQVAFDILDKAESLLDYSRDRSGRGFTRLLQRRLMEPVLDRAWERLPVQLRARFRAQGRRLFALVYDHTKEGVFVHRRTKGGVKLGATPPYRTIPWDTYVPQFIRSVRNSSHGLMQLDRGELDVMAIHEGRVSSALPELVALIALAILGDFERVRDGTWWQ